MNRRDFLKSVAAIAGVAAIPAYALNSDVLVENIDDDYQELLEESWKRFNPRTSYGNVVYLNDHPSTKQVNELICVLDRNIYETVPLEYRAKVEYSFKPSGGTIDPFDQLCSLSWKYSPRHSNRSNKITKAAIMAI